MFKVIMALNSHYWHFKKGLNYSLKYNDVN